MDPKITSGDLSHPCESPGEYIFTNEDVDKWIYVVQEGKVVLLSEHLGNQFNISEFEQGEAIYSVLTFIDVLNCNHSQYGNLSALGWFSS